MKEGLIHATQHGGPHQQVGRGDLNKCGRSACLLACPCAASLPLTLLWLDIHLTVSLHGNSFAAVIVELIRYCPEVVFAPARAITMAWLSMYSEMVFPIISGIFLVIHMANSAPAASASYVLCLVLGPRYSFIVFTGQANPFLYSMADAPIPLSCPEPSEKTLKSAVSYHSYEIESSLDLAIAVVYLLFSALLRAVGSIVSSVRFLILKI